MLISRRKEGETLFIGEDIEVRIVSVRKKKVIFGVVAPKDIKVTAARLSPAALANTIAAVHSVNLDRLLPGIQADAEKPVLLLRTMQRAPETSDKEEGI
ncbi:MAG TPA: carbon storage regulator [Bryobacteraceae bacterium]|jgi:carbon storage regulator|nr:carbon storage regulator [Bryobacteraceae bacterium]